MSVELRIGQFGITRSIYTDLVNLPNPVKLGLTVQIFNGDSVTLYMRVDGYATGWTFTSNDFGAVGAGGNIYRNIDQFGSRAKPASAVTESITVRLRAYTDAGYTTLKWTFERIVDVIFINSNDGTWTQDVLNNFDDGTVQGWGAASEQYNKAGYPTLAVATDYFLSSPYSLKMTQAADGAIIGARIYKSFTTPNRNNVFAIFDVRQGQSGGAYMKNLRFNQNATLLVYLGRAKDTVASDYVPPNRWTRVILPLPKNTTLELRVGQDWHSPLASLRYAYLWMDDFRIISKD